MAAPTHWAIYCPLGDQCQMGNKKVNGWKTSENDARAALYQHLCSTAHGLEDEEATKLTSEAAVETWGPSDKKRKAETAAASQPASQRRAIADGAAPAAPEAASSSSQGGQFTQLRLRAEQAEDQLDQIGGVITRMIEAMTKSVATMETAAQFARTAASAFDHNYHELKAQLEAVQQLYSTATTVRSMQFGGN